MLVKTPLLPTQVEDVEWQSQQEDVPNFSGPGTGKTLTTIGSVERCGLQSGLVVCPTIATQMWTRLLSLELGARTQWLKTRGTKIDKTADFLVASYGIVGAHFPELIERDNEALIVDESHYIKSKDAARTQVLLGDDCDGIGGLFETCEQCWMLTGTPIERYSDDLWTQLRATHPAVLHEYNSLALENFQRNFCRMAWKQYHERMDPKYVSVGDQNTAILNKMIYDKVGAIRRTLEEVEPNMPPMTERIITVDAVVDAELRALLKNKTVADIVKMAEAQDTALTTMRRLMGVAKAKSVGNYVLEASAQHPVLVGFWHTELGEVLYNRLGLERRTALVHGGTSPRIRELVKKDFMRGELDVVVGQIQSMGVAMDGLQVAGAHVIFAEWDWSDAKNEQFYKRLFRKGQRSHVQVDYCMAPNVLDEAVWEVSGTKKLGTKQIMEKR